MTNVKENGQSTNGLMKRENTLPTFQDLHQDPEQAFKNDQFKSLLYKDPPKSWLKVNKYANNSLYLPIDKNEYLLDSIFQEWKIEVISYSQLFNSVSCHVRVHYLNPTNGKWYFHDGVGAEELQTKQGSSPAELSNINKNAVAMALPIAKSKAIKDASHHLGRIFGRDLNREEVAQFTGAYSQPVILLDEILDLYELKKSALTDDERKDADKIIKNQDEKSYHKLQKFLASK